MSFSEQVMHSIISGRRSLALHVTCKNNLETFKRSDVEELEEKLESHAVKIEYHVVG